MKHFISILLLVQTFACWSNMASPFIGGDRGIKEVTSKDADVTDEKIDIYIDSAFQEIKFKVSYNISLTKSGKSIPLLFIALGSTYPNKEDFIIHCDDKRVTTQDIPYDWVSESPHKYLSFEKLWLVEGKSLNENLIQEEDSSCQTINTYHLHDMYYFEVDLDSGIHNITIEYKGSPSIHRTSWINKYEIDYALSPIEYWKSHSAINVAIHSKINLTELTSNYPIQVSSSKEGSILIDSITKCNLSIKYSPRINERATQMIQFGQQNMTIVFGLIIFLFHIVLIWIYRRYVYTKYSLVLILGSLFFPFSILLFYMYTYDIIDDTIGIHASNYHGYTFFIMIFYPILCPIYWLIAWLIDKVIKMKTEK